MTTINTWPNPARPGVPLNPEKDGWHWVSGIGGDPEPFYWNGIWRGSDQFSYYSFGESCRYFGPVLLPDEAAALQKRVAKLEGVLDFYACVDHYQMHNAAAPNVVQTDRGAKARAALGGKDE